MFPVSKKLARASPLLGFSRLRLGIGDANVNGEFDIYLGQFVDIAGESLVIFLAVCQASWGRTAMI